MSIDARMRAARVLPAVLVVASLAAGCASSPGGITATSPLRGGVDLSNFSSLTVGVDGGGEVSLTPEDKARISRLIVDAIKKNDPGRFKELNPQAPDPSTLRAAVTITRYEKGNAFARFMLMGLGQIHIDGNVVLRDATTEDALGRYEVTKTFAWGGIYGAVTRIDDVEEGFAEAVAGVLLGKSEAIDPPASATSGRRVR